MNPDIARISQSFIDVEGKHHTWTVCLGPEPGWYPVTSGGHKTGCEILQPGETGLGFQARFLGSRIGPRKDFAFESPEKALSAVLVDRTTRPNGERSGRICEQVLKTDHAGRSAWSIGCETQAGTWTVRIRDRETDYRIAPWEPGDGFVGTWTDAGGRLIVAAGPWPTIDEALYGLAAWHADGGPAIVRE